MSVQAAYLSIILIWSTTPLAIQWSTDGVSFLFALLARMTVGVIVCLLLLKIFRIPLPMHKQARRVYLAGGLGIYGAMLCVYWASRYIPSGLIAVLFGLSPLITSLVAAILLKERDFTLGKLLGLLLGVAGLAIIFDASLEMSAHALEGIAAVLTAVVWQSVSLVSVKHIEHDVPALAVTGGALLLAVPLFALTWVLAGDGIPSAMPLRAELAILYLGIFGSVLGFFLYFYVVKRLLASQTALITLITPVTALLLGHVLNNETIRATVWLGVAIISSGLILHQWRSLKDLSQTWRA